MTTAPPPAIETADEYILADDLEQLSEPPELVNLRSMPPGDIKSSPPPWASHHAWRVEEVDDVRPQDGLI